MPIRLTSRGQSKKVSIWQCVGSCLLQSAQQFSTVPHHRNPALIDRASTGGQWGTIEAARRRAKRERRSAHCRISESLAAQVAKIDDHPSQLHTTYVCAFQK
ncbi:hypothetical protein OH76DRAFT_1123101 [Lentinus brumalis]|uniref:Uncharacterized protein n=1 Tax=Lentinus brumalis TaxID=2498619 RepID=A0A371CUR2_9APHY|nr:hypothetical protein OH76DRAFT_1123101 [Polyporus brumalis]